MPRYRFRFAVMISCLLLSACAAKQEMINPHFAANRRVTLLLPADPAPLKTAEAEAIGTAISEYLYSQYEISAKPLKAAVSDIGQAVFEAARQKSDDFFWLAPSPNGGIAVMAGNTSRYEPLVQIVFAAGELTPWSGGKEKLLHQRLDSHLTKGYDDPNSLPKLDTLNVAQHFYAQKDCAKALPLYRIYLEEHSVVYITDIQQRGEIQSRVDECARKVAISERIRDDQGKGFALEFSQEGLSEKYAAFYREATVKSGLEATLKKYTLKPSYLQVHFNAASRSGSLLLKMRFHQTHYQRMVEKFPPPTEGHRPLYLSPYYPIFQKLLATRDLVAAQATGLDKETLAGFGAFFRLEKLTGDFVEMPVDISSDGQIKPPSQLTAAIAGFQPSTVQTQDLGLSKQTGYFYLGEAELISGQKTEYGILYSFFGLK